MASEPVYDVEVGALEGAVCRYRTLSYWHDNFPGCRARQRDGRDEKGRAGHKRLHAGRSPGCGRGRS